MCSMSTAEFELWESLQAVGAMEHGGARTTMLEQLVRRAAAEDQPRAGLAARRMLADAHGEDGRWPLVFEELRRSLREYDRKPWRFSAEDEAGLFDWYAGLVRRMVDFPSFGLDEITAALADVERRCRERGHGQRAVHAAERAVAAHRGDWEAEERAHVQWVAAGGADTEDGGYRAVGVERMLLRGDEASVVTAHALASPVLADPAANDPLALKVRCAMLLPLARAGMGERAALAYRRVLRGLSGRARAVEEHGRVVEFCALTGNEDAAVDWLGPMRGFEARERPSAVLEFATAVAVLAERVVRAGRGDTQLDLGAGDPNSVPFAVVARRMRRLALELAEEFDARNRTSAVGDRTRARLAAPPVARFLPLTPTSRPCPGVLPPAGLDDGELLDLAEQHDLRCEQEQARAALAAVGDELPKPLAGRQAELRARLCQGEETELRIRWAAQVHLRHGDPRRHLLALGWLGVWVIGAGRGAEGLALTEESVERLREVGGPVEVGWGEHWYAHALRAVGRTDEAHRALERAAVAAREARDAVLAAAVGVREAAWRTEDGRQAAQAREHAVAALDAAVSVEAWERAVEAVEQVRLAHERLGRGGAELRRFAEKRLRGLPPGRLAGHLRYLRGVALVEVDPGAAADDLNEAVGQAVVRGVDTAEHWYQLLRADHAAGRWEDAVDAGVRASGWLDHLVEVEGEGWAERADECRYLVARSYQRMGDRHAALREYRRLASGSGVLAAAAFIAGAEVMDESGEIA
ncbi:hypothetical protein APASM_4010 [Actinosynnema pretiosum subsp. pretiosum]|nr:hypothetical protein APASM_4010 [Actinosynnema pretiosum subsp. pretiosum]